MHVVSVYVSLISLISARGGRTQPRTRGLRRQPPPPFGPRPPPSASIKLFSRGGGNRRAAEHGGWTNRSTGSGDARPLGQWEHGKGRAGSQWGCAARARRARRAARSAGEVSEPCGRAGVWRPSASVPRFFPASRARCLLSPASGAPGSCPAPMASSVARAGRCGGRLAGSAPGLLVGRAGAPRSCRCQ